VIAECLKSNSQGSKSFFQSRQYTECEAIRLHSMPNGYCYFYGILACASFYKKDDKEREVDVDQTDLKSLCTIFKQNWPAGLPADGVDSILDFLGLESSINFTELYALHSSWTSFSRRLVTIQNYDFMGSHAFVASMKGLKVPRVCFDKMMLVAGN